MNTILIIHVDDFFRRVGGFEEPRANQEIISLSITMEHSSVMAKISTRRFLGE